MTRRLSGLVLSWFTFVALLLAPSHPPALQALPPAGPGFAAPTTPAPLQPVVGRSLRHDTSPPLREMALLRPQAGAARPGAPPREVPLGRLPARTGPHTLYRASPPWETGAALQRAPVWPNMPGPLLNFEGLSNLNSMLPPDPNGDIGYDPTTGARYYVQAVNVSFAVWDVSSTPTQVLGPARINTLWAGFGGPCEGSMAGDPIVLYDPIARRWLISQFALPNYPNGPFHQCLACSQTADPTGAWHRYDFQVHATKMNDYSKFGVWPDAYYMSVNQFTGSAALWAGAGVYAFDRNQILQGLPATFIYFDLYPLNPEYGGLLPADLDGNALPPAGAPNIYASVDMDWAGTTDMLHLFAFHADFATPANSTFTLKQDLPVAPFGWLCLDVRNCIPQPGTTAKVDAISDRLMHRLAYRRFAGHQALVANHTVDAGGGRAGVRWYELRNTAGSWAVYQQSTFAPDAANRWMASAAQDRMGNMAVGYSVSSGSIYPSVRYAGRVVTDTLNTLGQGEALLIAGGGSQTHTSGRWGDYSMMAVDPLDDCTFWYTNQYLASTSSIQWQTRIGSFRYPNCPGAGPITPAIWLPLVLAPPASAAKAHRASP